MMSETASPFQFCHFADAFKMFLGDSPIEISLFLFFSLFLDEYVSLTELSDENMTTLNQRLQPLIRLLESRYLNILDPLFWFWW